MRKTLTSLAVLVAGFGLAGCPVSDIRVGDSLTFDVINSGGSNIGTVTLTEIGIQGTSVALDITDLSDGVRAMHFHENAACDTPDFTTAGGHFNPTSSAHGTNDPNGPHAGDMMNITVTNGVGQVTVTNMRVSLSGDFGIPSLLDNGGSSLIIHAGADDYTSQPSGAAGPRDACAIIQE